MRTITAATVGRSDFGIYRPVLRAIQDCADLKLELIVAGAHLSPEFGWTVREIEASGFSIAERVDMLLSADTPAAIAKSMGLGTIGFAQAYDRCRPDILLVLGDRFEMHAAAAAAVPFGIPTAHIHGGEVTQGAIDDAFRHAITKYSHLHFVATERYARRVIQLGEEPWRVTVAGAPSLDNLGSVEWMTEGDLEREHGLNIEASPLLVTYHPVTLQFERTREQTAELIAALDACEMPIVITKPNADTSGRIIIDMMEQFGRERSRVQVVNNLGTRGYFSLMRIAAAMVGNSSSGIIEAASFGLPVINVGERQKGRDHVENVIDVPCEREPISRAIETACSSDFRAGLQGMRNPYGDGNAASRIVERLLSVQIDQQLIQKRFHDLPCD